MGRPKTRGDRTVSRNEKYISTQDTHAHITREKILAAAMEVVERDGMAALTVRNICDQAGLSTGSFYNLFSGKDDLINYYLQRAFRSYKERSEAIGKGYNTIEKCLLLYRNYVRCCKSAGIEFVSGLYAANNSPFFDFVHREDEDDLVLGSIRQYLEEGQENGEIRQDIDMEEALLRIASLVTGSMFYWCVFNGRIDVVYQTDGLLQVYLLSLATDPAMEISLKPIEKRETLLEELGTA